MSLKRVNNQLLDKNNLIQCDLNNDTLFKKFEIEIDDYVVLNKNQFLCIINKGKIIDIKDEEGTYILENKITSNNVLNQKWADLVIRDAETEELCVLIINKNTIEKNKYRINDPIKYKNWKNGEETNIYVKLEGFYNFKIVDSYKFLGQMVGLSSYYPKEELIERIRKHVVNSIEIGINEIADEYKLDINTLSTKSKELEIKLKQNEYDEKLLKYGVKLTYFDITSFEIAKKKLKIF